jgi:hypothetical protein
MLKRIVVTSVFALLVAGGAARAAEGDKAGGMVVDKEKRTITIPAKVAPRKINDPRYTEIYPIEAIATAPFPKGQKAHETVVTVDVTPSDVHKALESLGLKAGKPAEGEEGHAEGPALKVSLVLPGGKTVPMEKTLIDKKTGKPMGTVKWIFTGSAMRQPDPNKPEQVYGADVASNLIMFFPMTPDVVIQSGLTVKESNLIKLETNKAVLPPEGTEVKLVITPAK